MKPLNFGMLEFMDSEPPKSMFNGIMSPRQPGYYLSLHFKEVDLFILISMSSLVMQISI